MEIEGSDGSKTRLKPYSTTVFGRENGFHPNDLAVSRRHISFEFKPSTDPAHSQTDPRVSFEVLGKNPLWVFSSKNEDAKIMVFKRFQRGEMGIGDMFCLSPKNPVWFSVKKVEDERQRKGGEIEGSVNDELSQSLEISYGFNGNGEFGLDSVDTSSIDPVQEFGFLVIGHEYDQYPKQMIRDVKNWNWFLEDPRKSDSDNDDEEEKRGRRGKRKKKTRGGGGDVDDVDDEWTADTEDEAIVTTSTANPRKLQRPSYQTRSKHLGKGKSNKETKDREEEEEEDEESIKEDEEDETLGGFIVDDETVREEDEEDEEEEEEFVEDEELED